MKKVTVLGAGTWGVALTILLANNGHEVTLWSKFPAETGALEADRSNIKNLPGAVLPDSVKLTNDLAEAVAGGTDLIVNTVISPFVREVSKALSSYVKDGTVIVNASKGIENGTLYTMTDIISQEIPQAKVAVISGPSHAEEVSRHIPTTVVAGATEKDVAMYIQDMFMNKYFRVYTSPDVLGIEIGGALKNVIALAAGAVDGLGYGDNTKAALITRGIVEIARLGEAMGARYETFAGLSGIGDLIVTCTSLHSRNHNAGYLLGQGKSLEEAKREVGQVVEGVNSAQAALALAEKYGVEMPIVEQVNAVLFEQKDAKEALKDLLVRDKVTEYSSLSWE
ncbi:MAG: NAD(P)H-dependent glycerol-3-phosphate dehydrogenase [Lachnospiraceae bacterium]|nr:NAD(P)H-dependent glycerol-3-phosphate dehydrogenase [Lachnospiraceae bacterium]